MSELPIWDKLPAEPLFKHKRNEPIVIAKETVSIYCGENKLENVKAKILLEFEQWCKIRIKVSTNQPHSWLRNQPHNFTLIFNDSLKVECYYSGSSHTYSTNSEPYIEYRFGIKDETVFMEQFPAVDYMLLHLINFPKFHSKRPIKLEDETTVEVADYLLLEDDNWRITICQKDDGKSGFLIEELRNYGGFHISHVVKVERKNNIAFTYKEFDSLRWGLQNFLSFVVGRNIGFVLPAGFSSDGSHQWTAWLQTKCDSWFDPHFKSFDELFFSDIEPFFPGFIRKWNDSTWHDTLETVTYWFLQANQNSIGLDTSIILVQSALEKIAWTFLTQEDSRMSSEAFKNLRTTDCLRILFSFLTIPKEVPETLINLKKAAKELGHLDGIQTFVEARNSIIHPEKRKKNIFDLEIPYLHYEINCLGLWYLELLVFRLCGYEGKYKSRVGFHGTGYLESLPWLSDSESKE